MLPRPLLAALIGRQDVKFLTSVYWAGQQQQLVRCWASRPTHTADEKRQGNSTDKQTPDPVGQRNLLTNSSSRDSTSPVSISNATADSGTKQSLPTDNNSSANRGVSSGTEASSDYAKPTISSRVDFNPTESVRKVGFTDPKTSSQDITHNSSSKYTKFSTISQLEATQSRSGVLPDAGRGATASPVDKYDVTNTSQGATADVSNTSRVMQAPGIGATEDETRGALAQEPRPKGAVGYVLSRYTWYIERLQQSLKNEMPRTFRMFRIFSVGLKAFAADFTGYVRLLVQLSFPSVRLEHLTRAQLELYLFMPWDMLKVFPVLAISAVPLGQNLALPLGYLFPRHLLCRHFWDLQQTHDFSMRALRSRLYNARPVFRCVQARVEDIPELRARVQAQSTCHQLGSGVHPSADQVLDLRRLFREKPYALNHITRHHVSALARLHGVSQMPGKRARLRDYARWLRCHDTALLLQEGGAETSAAGADNIADGDAGSLSAVSATDRLGLSSQHVSTLKTSLLVRGISPIGLDSSAMVEVLLRWLSVARHLTREDDSLLLHLPLMLYYNHPTNLALISP